METLAIDGGPKVAMLIALASLMIDQGRRSSCIRERTSHRCIYDAKCEKINYYLPHYHNGRRKRPMGSPDQSPLPLMDGEQILWEKQNRRKVRRGLYEVEILSITNIRIIMSATRTFDSLPRKSRQMIQRGASGTQFIGEQNLIVGYIKNLAFISSLRWVTFFHFRSATDPEVMLISPFSFDNENLKILKDALIAGRRLSLNRLSTMDLPQHSFYLVLLVRYIAVGIGALIMIIIITSLMR